MTTPNNPQSDLSRAQRLALLPEKERHAFFSSLTDDEIDLLQYDWDFWARPKQLPPASLDWSIWLLLAGRGFGKTAAVTNWASLQANGRKSRGILAAPTAADVRDILVEGETGLLNVGHPKSRPVYEPSKRRLTWANGSTAVLVSADEPDRFRGLQGHWAAIDELCAWRHPEAFDMLMMGLRLGDHPLLAIATTPRPIPLLIQLIKEPGVVISKGSSYENKSNLAPTYIKQTLARYEGTRLGRQELYAEILTDTPGALWKRDRIEALRRTQMPELVRIVVAIDPAASANPNSSETGIVVAGLGVDGHGYVLDDMTISDTPAKWAGQAIAGFRKYGADRIIGETNNGGDMVESTVRSVDASVPFKQVRASRNKQTRAEPVSALYEQGKVHHLGMFAQLEDQMVTWVPGEKSPDRCFVAGTLITTDAGDIAIEAVKPGMRVITRAGYRWVLAAGMTSAHARVITAVFSNGQTLTGTANHPIFTVNRGFVPLDTIVWDDIIVSNRYSELEFDTWQKKKLSYSMELPSFVTQTRKANQHAVILCRSLTISGQSALGRFTRKYGNRIMAIYRRGVIFITKMVTRSIMPLIIWNASRKRLTVNGMPLNSESSARNMQTGFAPSRRHGTPVRKAGNGMLSMVNKCGLDVSQKRNSFVLNVGSRLRAMLKIPMNCAFAPESASIATTSEHSDMPLSEPVLPAVHHSQSSGHHENSRLALVNVDGIVEEKNRQAVYNLTVEDAPEYFANGILVHNCDALVWAITELMLPEDQEEEVVTVRTMRTRR